MYSFSPSPSPAPPSPPHHGAAQQGQSAQSPAQGPQQTPGRYGLMPKPLGPQFQSHPSFSSFGGPPTSFAGGPLNGHPSAAPLPFGPPPGAPSHHHLAAAAAAAAAAGTPGSGPPSNPTSLASLNGGPHSAAVHHAQALAHHQHQQQQHQQAAAAAAAAAAHHMGSSAQQQAQQHAQQAQQQAQQQQQGGGAGNNGMGAPLSQHWQHQMQLASISRQSGSPHHHARAAHLSSRGQNTSAAITITDPTKSNAKALAHLHASSPSPVGSAGVGMNGHQKKDSSGVITRPDSAGPDDYGGFRSSSVASGRTGISGLTASRPNRSGTLASNQEADGSASSGEKETCWTAIDMGGMNLRALSTTLFRYDFLTNLYIGHNSLSQLPTAIAKLKHLTVLDVSSNKLTSVPPELGLCWSLTDLLMFDNLLEELPGELGMLFNLKTLGIEGNPLQDALRARVDHGGTNGLIEYLRDSCPVSVPPGEREWVPVEPDPPAQKPTPPTFTVMCYNVLCEKYATAQIYGYTPSWALAWEYRKDLVLQEIYNCDADVVCLQEVDIEQFESFFLPNLAQHGYEGVHYPKSRARTMSSEERRRVDGCATFFRSKVFSMVEQQLIEFNQSALRRPDFKRSEDMFNRVMNKDNVAVVTLLEHRASGARLIAANAHIHWDPTFRDVKLVQAAMLMEELEKIGDRFARLGPRPDLAEGYTAPKYDNGLKIPTIVCGDFNSEPTSGVYEFLSEGRVSNDHDDFMSHVYGDYTATGVGAKHRLGLKSAYSHVGELPFTNYTPGFTGVIDYVWYTPASMGVVGLCGEVDRDYAQRVVGYPNAHNPSDHIPLLAEFRFR